MNGLHSVFAHVQERLMLAVVFVVMLSLTANQALAQTSFGVGKLQNPPTVRQPWSLATGTVTVAIIFACLAALLFMALHYRHRVKQASK